MKIFHRITVNLDLRKKAILESFGLVVNVGLSTLVIEEEDAKWHLIKKFIAEWKCVDIETTKFTEDEFNASRYLLLNASSHWGYPQPEDKFGYLAESYDLTLYCNECGTGKVLKSPFKMTGEPSFARRDVLQLNWVFDIYFCQPGVFEQVFSQFGIQCEKVLHYGTGGSLMTVVQLVPQAFVDCGPGVQIRSYTSCDKCGRMKYLPITRGFFPKLHGNLDFHYFSSNEEFGSGKSAHHAVFISNKLYQKMKALGLNGVSFVPVGS